MKTILVVRKFDDFSRILAANNFKVINLPLIETKSLDDTSDFEAKLAAIENYDGVFLTSQYATGIFREKLAEKKTNYRGKVYVLGNRSYALLKTENLDLVFDETANTAREMLEKIALEDLEGKRFLFVRGEKSLRVVPDFFARMATVDETIVYETRSLKIGANQLKILREKFENKTIAAACFFSPSAAESFVEQFGAEILHQIIVATIGKTTAEFFATRNVPVSFVSSKANPKNFAVELAENLGRSLATDFHR